MVEEVWVESSPSLEMAVQSRPSCVRETAQVCITS